MNEHKAVPNIRFKGFDDEWEDEKLGKITKYVKGYAFESRLYTENGIRIIKVTDLTKKKIREENKSSTYIFQTTATKFKKYIIHQKDIIITTVGSKTKLKSSSVGRAIYVDKSRNYLLNQNLVKITALSDFDSFFIYSQLEQPKYINYISKIERGNANQANIEIKDLWNYLIKVSSIKEQQKIGNLFFKLDKLLYLQQQKIDKWDLLKKALLQGLFPKHNTKIPELRFKGFQNNWEKIKLKNYVTWYKGSGLSKKYINAKNIGAPVIHYSDLYKFSEVIKNVKHWSTTNQGKFISNNSILFPSSDVTPNGLARTSALLKNGIKAGGDIIIGTLKTSLSNVFMSYQINRNYKDILRMVSGTTIRHIHAYDLSNLTEYITYYPEQQKIGNLLSKVDQLIELENKKLHNLQQVKKCLLQNMFVE